MILGVAIAIQMGAPAIFHPLSVFFSITSSGKYPPPGRPQPDVKIPVVLVSTPYGRDWYPYLMRRMAERPANLLFVLNAVARETPLGRLLADRGDGR
jgi:hypothetical protein